MNPDAMTLAYKYRVYPSKQETSALEAQLREAARLYNAALQERRDAWVIQRKRITFASQDAQLKEIRAAGDLGLPTYDVATDVLRRVDLAFRAFFRRAKAKKGQAGHPRFKSSRAYDSLTFPHYRRGIALNGDRLRVAGVGSVKVRLHRQPDGDIKAATIRRDGDRWYVVLACRQQPNPKTPVSGSIGIDVGLSAFVADSQGRTVAAPRLFRESERRLRRAQRKLSRCKRRSRRRELQRVVVARLHARVRNQRADFHHKLSRKIVDENQHIAVEDLNIAGLARTRLAKSIHDAGWALFLNKLTYKAERAGRQVVKVNPAGTSQVCVCGASVPKSLKDRWHSCSQCGLSEPRDVVSAKVILARSAPSVANMESASC